MYFLFEMLSYMKRICYLVVCSLGLLGSWFFLS